MVQVLLVTDSDVGLQFDHCIFSLYHFHTFLYTPSTLNHHSSTLSPSALQFCN